MAVTVRMLLPASAGHRTGGLDSGNLSMRTAAALNSAVPDFGSVASIVSTFVSTWSGKWNVMNTSPGRSASSTWTGTSTDPRRLETTTHSVFGEAEPLGVLGRDVDRLPAAQR